ncbi:ras-related protein Rab-39A [Tupaia chinensis]|uniref:ras-related protein Rab-39A n=1 Tax=Tupaia chinensis TaxID=246437 RepID=UPI0003C8F9C5|nr:ras-related protein Rab-39A [Tupaia chinensis]
METIWIYQFRLIVIGDSTVGKSCLLHRFTQGRFPGLRSPACDPTVGVDFFSRLLEIEPGKRIKLQLWDTAGQERVRSITRSYYRNSVGGFLVFDITNRRSFEHVKDWLEEAKMHVQPFRIVFLLVGHKCDLASQRQVTREEAEKLSADCGMKYIETSAKDATNVEESFTILTRDIYELIKKGEICIQDGWEGVKSGFVPNTVHSSEEAVKRINTLCPHSFNKCVLGAFHVPVPIETVLSALGIPLSSLTEFRIWGWRRGKASVPPAEGVRSPLRGLGTYRGSQAPTLAPERAPARRIT